MELDLGEYIQRTIYYFGFYELPTVAVVRSRPTSTCVIGTVYYYAKLQVVRIDTIARRIDYNILVDLNCGYRGLEPGIPKR